MKQNHKGIIQNINKEAENVYLIQIYTSTVNEIFPGQYISVLCEDLTFRRPFSVFDFKNNVISILVKKRGKGTLEIISKNVNDNIEFSAPLGNGFSIENKKALLIGAGIGVAPLFYLNKELKKMNVDTYFAAGFLDINDIIGKDLDFISTDNGSNGNKGSICDYLEKLIKEFKPEKIVSCAPYPVLRYVAQMATKYGIKCEICMEKVMACGIGVCRGCAIKVKKEGMIINKTVCKDGPVFDASEIVWEVGL